MKRPYDWFYLSVLIVLAIFLRAPLVHTGLTIDDACTAYVVEAQNWSDFVERIRTIEMSPPLYFAMLRIIVGIFGLTTPVLAITSLVFTVAIVPLTYLLGRACVPDQTQKEDQDHNEHLNQAPGSSRSTKVGLCAAFFAATSLLSIIYGHEARTYALASLLITLSLLLFVPFFDGRATRMRQFALFMTTALTAYTHYTAVPYFAIMILMALIYRKSGPSRSLLAVPPMVAGLATLSAWYPILKYHGSVGTPWVDPTPLTQCYHICL
jgi:4-amino-4-deoxy-L-arabinose transferase-like glycosyltransferase